MNLRTVVAIILLCVAGPRAGARISIANDQYVVSVRPAEGTFTVADKAGGRTFVTEGRLPGGGTGKAIELSDKTFGNGRSIEVIQADGNRDVIALFPATPFVLFKQILHNGGAEAVVLNHVPAVSAKLDLGKPASALQSLGTGGLLRPAKNPGSYAFAAVVDPDSRSGVVAGWITEDRGSGVVFTPVENDHVGIKGQIDYGRLRIKPGEDAETETLAIGCFTDARDGLEAYADQIARIYSIKLRPQRPGYCTWYMEKHGSSCDEKHLLELSQFAAAKLKPFGFDFIQIDDGWQEGIKSNGPKKNFTAFAHKGPYSSGMKGMAGEIDALGLTPGIWFMPFAGNFNDPFFAPHQDWFVKTVDGKPYDTAWGGTCLDMTQPDARQYVTQLVSRISHDWGYRLFKMDGFWTGSATRQVYINNGYRDDGMGDAVFSNPDKTNIEALRDGVKLIRNAAGPDVFFLGCCVSQNMRSFGGSFGLLDAMRVGPDTGAGDIGAPHASRLWFLNGRVWWNDPDCVSVRASNTLDRSRLNATFTAMAGDLFYNSDWMPDLPPQRLDILRRCLPSHGLHSRPVDVFEHEPAQIWHLPDSRDSVRRNVVALYNWNKSAETISCSAERIGLPPATAYAAFDFWENKFVTPFSKTLEAQMPPASCRILAIRPVSDHPQLLSTSRHITQGMIDVRQERWDGDRHSLSAISEVVGDDPYELRVIVPEGEHSWHATEIVVSPEDKVANVTAHFAQDGPYLRATIRSVASRAVKWMIRFEPGKVDSPAALP